MHRPHLSCWVLAIIMGIVICTSGCSKPSTGDRSAVSSLIQQQIGVVFRAKRYVTKNSVPADSAGLAYGLTANGMETIAAALRDQFKPVILQTFTKKPLASTDLKFDGDLVLVSPNSHAKTMPPDDALRSIMTSEHLAALIIVDEEWTITDQTAIKLAECNVTLTMVDPAGRELFKGSVDDAVQLLGFTSNLLLEFDRSTAGQLPSEQVQTSKEMAGSFQTLYDKLGKKIAASIDGFIKGQP